MNANTTLRYLYRDAQNYKRRCRVTFAGLITPEQDSRFRAHLLHSRHLIPEQIGLPDLLAQMSSTYEEDAPWRHEFLTFEATLAEPNDPRTIDAFIDEVLATTWNAAPSPEDLAGLTLSHHEDLDDLLDLIRTRVHRATQVELQTFERATYGFTLHDIVHSSGQRRSTTDPHLLDELQEEGWPYLANIDRNGIVGEDEQGHAAIHV